ncbi:tRNA-intron endonuclease catalytic domain-like protein [Wolfiporia cocos MD-104 SS10]|uniref:tRNA-splicing endonuclease subunit Sen34 n=1 Tax=Wolfiporia cocos (strain MD-104) TaxID=742152 RepID=A0A2H3JL73_WOLCO|nr:tRNA-intron endonuclease catalytic domain-like protein [Wolfiporia cocos MD-104 SS10]
MPEEVVLLVQKELAVLVDDGPSHRTPSIDALKWWNSDREASAKLQIAAAEAKEASEKATKFSMTEDALRKRKEREERRAAAARAKALAEGVELDETAASGPTAPPPPPAERPATPSAGTSNAAPLYTVTIPASSTSLSWYDAEQCTYSTIEEARAAGVWTYPADLHERAKCGVFRGLWEQNYFMGGGIKFGGDFLVYPGDPLRYHSHFVATVIDAPISTIKPMEIVAHGRLGTATKKAHLLCGWDDEKQEVTYFSIEWAGFG